MDNNYQNEPKYRTTINRIYYGLMHFVKNRKNITVSQQRKWHTEIIEKATDLNQFLGGCLKNIKDYRVIADYSLNTSIGKNDVEAVIAWLEKAMNYIII